MSDYTRALSGGATAFGDKDALSTGDSNKIIVGAEYDTEFNAIVTASATKYDSDNLANQAAAEAGTSNTVLMTPLRTEQWSAVWAAENGGIVGNLHALADPGSDKLFGWDESVNDAIAYTVGAGLTITTTQLDVDMLGLEDLTDPGADRIYFWDDGAGNAAFLAVSTGLTLSGTSLTSDDSAIIHDDLSGFVLDEHVLHAGVTITGATNSGITGGGNISASRTLVFDITDLAEFAASDNFDATDEFVVSDGGTAKRVDYQHMGLRIVDETASTTLDLTDANSMIVAAHASVDIVITIPAESSVDYALGTFIHVMRNGAAEVDVAVTTDTHTAPNGKSNTSNGSVTTLIKIASATWVQFGDVKA